MSNQRIRELLASLQDELHKTHLDSQTREEIRSLDGDLHRLLDENDTLDDSTDILDRAKLLEARFANDYPTATPLLREFINTLSRLGI